MQQVSIFLLTCGIC